MRTVRKPVLVTGADGFIGTRLVARLRADGFEVRCHSIAEGDICDIPLHAFQEVSRVFHLAGLTFVPASWENPQEYYRVNVLGTARVLEGCRQHRCALTFMSTYVYGMPQYLPVDEAHPAVPNAPYNHGKFLAEQLCSFYHRAFDVPSVVFRPFNIYGYGQAPYFLIPEIVAQLLDETTDTIQLMSLSPKRDYVYVDDVVDALALSMGIDSGFEVLNLGSGESHSVEEIARIAMEVSGIHKVLRSKHVDRKNEVTDICASIERAKALLSWRPAYGIREGLGTMIGQWKNEKKD